MGRNRLSGSHRPDRFDVTPRFKTFSYCRGQAIEGMKAIQIKSGGDYECGFQCELSGDPHHMTVCKEVRSSRTQRRGASIAAVAKCRELRLGRI
jgi:hypothetical protein